MCVCVFLDRYDGHTLTLDPVYDVCSVFAAAETGSKRSCCSFELKEDYIPYVWYPLNHLSSIFCMLRFQPSCSYLPPSQPRFPCPSMSLWQTQAERDLAQRGCRIWLHLDFIVLLFSLLALCSDWTWWDKVRSVWASAPDCCWHWSTDSHESLRDRRDNRKAVV